MLVLSRKKGERIFIGAVVVKVIEIQGNCQVRLGIEAPADVAIEREEVRVERLEAERGGFRP